VVVSNKNICFFLVTSPGNRVSVVSPKGIFGAVTASKFLMGVKVYQYS
jgi:hypothetical protein